MATTNLDVPVGVLWNIGGIAASGHPQAGELIAKILLASASIPGAFPPVMIDIEAGGEHFQEMHVDGGTVAQVVFYPPSFARLRPACANSRRKPGESRHCSSAGDASTSSATRGRAPISRRSTAAR